jgi:hypothetical protein
MLTIIDTSLHGSTLFVEAQDDTGRISRYALDWATYESQGMRAVLNAIHSAGSTPGQRMPAWVQQLVGMQVAGS